MTVALKRQADWRRQLNAFVNSVRRRPHSWDGADCAVAFAGGAVLAITGADLVADWRGTFTTAAEAAAQLHERGFADVAEAVSAVLPEHEHASQARVGDVMAIADETAFGYALGICNGASILVVRPDGLGLVDLLSAARAWKVG
jgi:hypothetical protein